MDINYIMSGGERERPSDVTHAHSHKKKLNKQVDCKDCNFFSTYENKRNFSGPPMQHASGAFLCLCPQQFLWEILCRHHVIAQYDTEREAV